MSTSINLQAIMTKEVRSYFHELGMEPGFNRNKEGELDIDIPRGMSPEDWEHIMEGLRVRLTDAYQRVMVGRSSLSSPFSNTTYSPLDVSKPIWMSSLSTSSPVASDTLR